MTAVRSTERSPDEVFVVLEDGTEVTIGLFVTRLCDDVSSRMRKRGLIYVTVYKTVVQMLAGEYEGEEETKPSETVPLITL